MFIYEWLGSIKLQEKFFITESSWPPGNPLKILCTPTVTLVLTALTFNLRTYMLHGTELGQTWVCAVWNWLKQITKTEVKTRNTLAVLNYNSLQQYGPCRWQRVAKKYMDYEVHGARLVDLKETWKEIAEADMKNLNIKKEYTIWFK